MPETSPHPRDRRPKIAVVLTSVLQVRFFLMPHLRALAQRYDVTLILKNDHPDLLANLDLPVRLVIAPIERPIRPVQDIKGLWFLIRLFGQERFDLVHTLAPKAGLLGMLAAWITRTPVRWHTFQGEAWASRTGLMRWLLRTSDRWVSRLATHITAVSPSERELLIDEGILPRAKSCVLANGSIGGVDLDRFSPNAERRQHLRAESGLSDQDVQFLYLGRLNIDKGLLELAQAFAQLAAEMKHVHLRFVGPDEEGMQERLAPLLASCADRVSFAAYTPKPEDSMQGADVLVLPSYREGLPVVIIEAAGVQVPSIASRIYGTIDALVDQETGLLFTVRDTSDLLKQMRLLASDGALRERLGRQARVRVQQTFDQRLVIQAFLDHYAQLLQDA